MVIRPTRRTRPPARPRQRGAALLIALLIMTLVATLAAGMVWIQWRGIQVEASERARTQASWLLNSSLDWGNLILKSNGRSATQEDDLTQPWATPLAETKLSSFLSADGNHSEEAGPEAYLSGQITDATSKYNVFNIILDTTKFDEVNRLAIICNAVGVPASTATVIGSGLRDSWNAQQAAAQSGQSGQSGNSVLMPQQVDDLAWYGVDPKVLKQLKPFIQILPVPIPNPAQLPAPTSINANTAPAEVLQAAIPGITPAQAQQIILTRQSHPFQTKQDIWAVVGGTKVNPPVPPQGAPQLLLADVLSSYFEIYGQLRFEQHTIRERSIVFRVNRGGPIQVLRRERVAPDPA